jgi:acyl-CoA synthetase (AMP-forming)/AMP-acid ligase II
VGLILVNINPAYRTSEVAYALNRVGCQLLVTMGRFKTSDDLGRLRELAPEWAHGEPGRLESQQRPHLRTMVWIDEAGQGADKPGWMRFSQLLAMGDESDARVAAAAASLKPTEPINIQSTSGTTGFSKGATLTHRNILNNGFFIGEGMKLTPADRLCIPVPLYHCFGMVLGNLACLTHGATIAHGMTETSPVSCQSSTTTPLDKRVSTVSQVQPPLEVKIIDAERGETVAPGERGELCTRGYSVMHGYWGDPAKTAEAMDAEGCVKIVGRIKDMVIRGGENSCPRETEEFFYRHLAVQDVPVVGVPDAKYGEELCAWIVLTPEQTTTDVALREFCQGQIAHHKIPRYMRFVSEFPMTVSGKIQKFKIRDAMKDELGLTETRTA